MMTEWGNDLVGYAGWNRPALTDPFAIAFSAAGQWS